jgi:hypothetical protein
LHVNEPATRAPVRVAKPLAGGDPIWIAGHGRDESERLWGNRAGSCTGLYFATILEMAQPDAINGSKPCAKLAEPALAVHLELVSNAANLTLEVRSTLTPVPAQDE